MSLMRPTVMVFVSIVLVPTSATTAERDGPRLHLESCRGVAVAGDEVTAWADGDRWVEA